MVWVEHVASGISASHAYVVHARVAVFLMRRVEARAIYEEKRDEWCVLRLGLWLLVVCCWLFGLKIII